jgi:hypothetical protein
MVILAVFPKTIALSQARVLMADVCSVGIRVKAQYVVFLTPIIFVTLPINVTALENVWRKLNPQALCAVQLVTCYQDAAST